MELNEYQRLASRTLNPDQGMRNMLVNGALGLAGESGEAADLVKKHVFHGHDLDVRDLADELGDVLWYISQIATSQGLTMEQIARRNITKLQERYPDGFVRERSIKRRRPEEEGDG